MLRINRYLRWHYSRQTIAAAIGVSKATLARVEAGESVSPATSAKVAAFAVLDNDEARAQLKRVAKAERRIAKSAERQHYHVSSRVKNVATKAYPQLEAAPAAAVAGTFYLDEAYGDGSQMLISAVAHQPVLLARLKERLYAGQWPRLDETKARDIPAADTGPLVADLLQGMGRPQVFWFPAQHLGQATLSPWYPYLLVALSLASNARDHIELQVDRRPPFMSPSQCLAASRLVNKYLKAHGVKATVSLLAVNSKQVLGIQAADLVASAALRLPVMPLAAAGVDLVMFPQLLAQPLFADFPAAFTKWAAVKPTQK